MEIKTPGGYVAKLKKDYLTVRESQVIQGIYLKDAKLKDGKPEMDLILTFEAQKKIFETLVAEITTKDGTVIKENLHDYYQEMPSGDGLVIMEKLQEIAYGKKNDDVG